MDNKFQGTLRIPEEKILSKVRPLYLEIYVSLSFPFIGSVNFYHYHLLG